MSVSEDQHDRRAFLIKQRVGVLQSHFFILAGDSFTWPTPDFMVHHNAIESFQGHWYQAAVNSTTTSLSLASLSFWRLRSACLTSHCKQSTCRFKFLESEQVLYSSASSQLQESAFSLWCCHTEV